MSYLVLARKYRPRAFAEVSGQDIVTRTLKGAIAEERVGHAYLFFGPRGTGKTTSARLFAKALNCEQGPTDEPCGVCERCESYDAGTEVDLIEIDAASNTGVDNVRALRDQAGYVPLRARFKVFLIDEVHMLSKGAFNALLKTLEEPPPHVKFLFATTELHKVPDTVVSRCQVLRLSPLSDEQIISRLDEVFRLEGIEAEAGVAAEIARRARGGMRDALSLADQLLALVGRKPTVADTARLAGEGSVGAIEEVLDAILAGDKRALLTALPARAGGEAAFLDGMLDYLRAALILRVVGEDAPMVADAGGPAVRAGMAQRASHFGADRLELVLADLLHARERMGPLHMRAHARLVLESSLLDLCVPEATLPIGDLCRRLEELEQRLGGAPASPAGIPQATTQAPQAGPPQGAPPAPPRPQAPAQSPAQPQGRVDAGAPQAAYVPPSQRGGARQSGPPPTEGGDPAPAPNPPAGSPGAPSGAPARAPAKAPVAEPPTRVIQPAAPPAGARSGVVQPPRVQTNSTADRWAGFLSVLGERVPQLAAICARKGTLVRDSGGTAPLKFQGLTHDERGMVDDPRSVQALVEAFRSANGDAIVLKVEHHDGSRSGVQDAFAAEIVEMFGGRIEG